jgi:hypothetical protein
MTTLAVRWCASAHQRSMEGAQYYVGNIDGSLIEERFPLKE